MRESTVVAIISLVVVGAGVAWFLLNFERVDVNERGQPSAIVRTNPNYGFGQFLEHYNIEFQQLSSLNTRTQLPDTSDTLVIDFDAIYMTGEETQRLANWVTSGGHLVLPLPYDSDESILSYFNIHTNEDDEEDNEEDETVSEEGDESLAETEQATTSDTQNEDEEPEEFVEPETPSRYVYEARFNGSAEGQFSLTYEVYDDLYSNRETLWTMDIEREIPDEENDKRTYALGFQYGLGSVSLLSDYAQWNNDNFYEDDNALLSLASLSQTRPPGKIWFIQTIRRASLWQIIWNNGAHLLLWLGLGIILFFWWAGQRLGRILPNPTLERREFNEHLIASGRFLWSNKKRLKLLAGAQEALANRMRRSYPRLHALTASHADLHLQDILEKDYDTWRFAMETPETQTKIQFLEQIKAIQRLWKQL